MLQLEGSLQTFWSRNLKLWASGCLLPKWLSSPSFLQGLKHLVICYQQLKIERVLLLVRRGHLAHLGSPCPWWQLPGAWVGRAWTCPSSAVSTQPTSALYVTCPHPRHIFFFFFFTPQRSSPSLCQEGNNGSSKVSWLVQGHTKARNEAQNWFRFQGSFSTMPWCKIMFLTSRP